MEMGSCAQREKIATSPNKTDFQTKNVSEKSLLGGLEVMFASLLCFSGRIVLVSITGKIKRVLPFRHTAQLNQHLTTISKHYIA